MTVGRNTLGEGGNNCSNGGAQDGGDWGDDSHFADGQSAIEQGEADASNGATRQRPEEAASPRKGQTESEREGSGEKHSGEVHERRKQENVAATGADTAEEVARSPSSDGSEAKDRG